MSPPEFQLETIVSRPFEENTYVLHREGQTKCLLVDPGLEPDKIFAYLDRQGLEPEAILLTHGHGDHIGGNAAVKSRWKDCPIYIGRGDAPKLSDPHQNLSAGMGGEGFVSPAADHLLDEGDVVELAGFVFEVLEIPGHSCGHIVFVGKQQQPVFVLGGDVLFAGSIGRTNFPDGNFDQLASGIRGKLYTLPDDTIVLPGHGPATTVGAEKRSNPFVAATTDTQ